MGFDIKRFRESDIKEEFICPICCDVLEEPILLEDCEHVFCRQCIDEWLQKCEHRLCPIDRQPIGDKPFRPPQRSFRNLITSLMIRCDYHSNGCQQFTPIEDMTVHARDCQFNPIIMNEQISCPQECGAIVKRCASIDDHNCVAFLKKSIDKNNDVIQKLCFENEKLLRDNNRLKPEMTRVRNELEESMKKLELMTKQKNDLIVELDNTRLKLTASYETLNKMSESIITKDNQIDRLAAKNDALELANLQLKKQVRIFRMNSERETVVTDSPDVVTEELISLADESGDDCDDIAIDTSVENQRLVETLTKKGYLTNKRVIRAMLSVDRGVFCPSAASYALHHCRPIGYGAHTGPATYEATVLQHLEPRLVKNCKVLDIGTGSGYVACCIAKMVAPEGKVIGIEHIPQLVGQSIDTIDKHYRYLRESGVLRLYASDGRLGCSPEAPFDLIFIEPLTRRIPQKLIDQLKAGGCIVVPIGGREKDITLELFTKQTNGEVVRRVLCDDWKLMQENTRDLLDDKKLQLRSGWKVKLGLD